MAKKKLGGAYISGLCRELGTTIRSGIPVSDGIYMLCEDNEGNYDSALLKSLYEETEKGVPFSEAVKSTGVFPSYVEEMIEVGEKSGHLDKTLAGLAEYYDRQDEIGRSIKNAVVFPSVLLGILIIIILVLLTQVLPIFNGVFEELGVSMSAMATALMQFGNSIMEYSALIVAVFAAAAVLLVILYKVPATKNAVVASFRGTKIRRQMSSVRFANAMSMTLSSGLDIDDSLEMAKRLCDEDTNGKIDRIGKLMKSGKPFDKAVGEAGIFGAVDSRRLSVSFKTGRTDEVMNQIAEDGEKKLNESIDEKISRIEPTLVVIMSVMVGLILFSVMMPMLSVITAV